MEKPSKSAAATLSVEVPLLDLRAQFNTIRDEVIAAVTRVLESQQFILGPEVTDLERRVAALARTTFAVACASGSDALILALMALGIGPGDEVITTPFTFFASAGSIARVGARPVFVDIDPGTYNLDAAALPRTITPRTKAIMPVHLFGQPAAMDEVMRVANDRGISVIEDAAQRSARNITARPSAALAGSAASAFSQPRTLAAQATAA
jgi:dTDP-4-amino-4,6-dideoxygalactose transaminase